jgi:hypothetical protein
MKLVILIIAVVALYWNLSSIAHTKRYYVYCDVMSYMKEINDLSHCTRVC